MTYIVLKAPLNSNQPTNLVKGCITDLSPRVAVQMDLSDLDCHLIYGSLDPRAKRHIDRFTCFYVAHLCAQHMDRQTDRPHYV